MGKGKFAGEILGGEWKWILAELVSSVVYEWK